jgi:ribosome maturation factor RimP
MAEIIASPLGLSILDVKIGQEGRRKTLEVTIYSRGKAVSLTDCENVSRALDKMLDEESEKDNQINSGLSSGAFLLEVVSPGTDRQLIKPSDFVVFSGECVRVTAKEHYPNLGSEFIGTLVGGDEKTLHISNVKPLVPVQKRKSTTKEKGKTLKQCDQHGAENVGDHDLMEIDMAKVFRVNLYADDSKRSAIL